LSIFLTRLVRDVVIEISINIKQRIKEMLTIIADAMMNATRTKANGGVPSYDHDTQRRIRAAEARQRDMEFLRQWHDTKGRW
jgi:acid phosphatase family membrane protein YuiD